jgi:hypothetical protein
MTVCEVGVLIYQFGTVFMMDTTRQGNIEGCL